MKSVDLSKLIEGLLVVILLAVAIGKYGALQEFARREAVASVRGWGTHAFFPGDYQKLIGAPLAGRVHLKGVAQGRSLLRSDQLKLNKIGE